MRLHRPSALLYWVWLHSCETFVDHNQLSNSCTLRLIQNAAAIKFGHRITYLVSVSLVGVQSQALESTLMLIRVCRCSFHVFGVPSALMSPPYEHHGFFKDLVCQRYKGWSFRQ